MVIFGIILYRMVDWVLVFVWYFRYFYLISSLFSAVVEVDECRVFLVGLPPQRALFAGIIQVSDTVFLLPL